ncbi:MAG: hypothetical protein SFX18_02710 [Pirellulales bacterium]|nr:hypothetical protein [Pirellulales bacterium]
MTQPHDLAEFRGCVTVIHGSDPKNDVPENLDDSLDDANFELAKLGYLDDQDTAEEVKAFVDELEFYKCQPPAREILAI